MATQRNKQNLGGVYANMEFPTYEYTEFPKHVVIGPHGKYVVIHNKEEENELLAKLQQDYDDAPPETVRHVVDPAKEILISRAAELGVAINRQWSVAKLQKVIQEVEEAVDNLPPEGDSVGGKAPVENKDELIAKAKSLGIKATHLWGIPRLKAEIAAAESE